MAEAESILGHVVCHGRQGFRGVGEDFFATFGVVAAVEDVGVWFAVRLFLHDEGVGSLFLEGFDFLIE